MREQRYRQDNKKLFKGDQDNKRTDKEEYPVLVTLVELARDLHEYTIDAFLDKPIEWIEKVYEINEKQKLDDRVQTAKLGAIAQRLDKDNLAYMERLFKIRKPEKDGKTEFKDDIRVIEMLGGTIEKIPKKKK